MTQGDRSQLESLFLKIFWLNIYHPLLSMKYIHVRNIMFEYFYKRNISLVALKWYSIWVHLNVDVLLVDVYYRIVVYISNVSFTCLVYMVCMKICISTNSGYLCLNISERAGANCYTLWRASLASYNKFVFSIILLLEQ